LTAYFGAAGTTVGAVGISEVDKLRKQFGKKDKGSGIVSSVKETAATIKRKLKPVGDAIYKAVSSPQAKALGAVAVIGIIATIIAQKMGLSRESVERALGNATNEFSRIRQRLPSMDEELSIEFGPFTNAPSRHELEEMANPHMGAPSPLEQSRALTRLRQMQDAMSDVLNSIRPVPVPRTGRNQPQTLTEAELDAFHTLDDAIQNINEGTIPDIRTPKAIAEAVSRMTGNTPYAGDNPYINELLRGPGLKKKRGRKGGKLVPTSVKKIVGTKRGENVRGAIVAEVMRKQGLTLANASKYVKEKGLY
jgi:hypothetical protein